VFIGSTQIVLIVQFNIRRGSISMLATDKACGGLLPHRSLLLRVLSF